MTCVLGTPLPAYLLDALEEVLYNLIPVDHDETASASPRIDLTRFHRATEVPDRISGDAGRVGEGNEVGIDLVHSNSRSRVAVTSYIYIIESRRSLTFTTNKCSDLRVSIFGYVRSFYKG